MSAAEFSKAFRVSYPNGSLVPPDRYVSQRVFDEGGPLQYNVTLHPPGGEIAASITAAGVRLEIGAPATWVVSVIHDISASERLERLRDQFFTAAAHSLKTPVSVIKADAQVLLPAIAAEHRPVAASIERQCDRIDRLVQNLIVLSRARTRTLELHPSELALEPLVEAIAHERIWSFRHQLRTEVSDCPPIHGDPERLALVIRNLVYEASRLSPADSPLTLIARPEGDGVAVGVRYQPVLWRDSVRDIYGEYDDIGIGRCVAETIAEGHGGTLREDARDGETTSWIHLPAGNGAHP